MRHQGIFVTLLLILAVQVVHLGAHPAPFAASLQNLFLRASGTGKLDTKGTNAFPAFYGEDLNNSWNVLYRTLFIRTLDDGERIDDLLDPPLWKRTTFLLDEGSNAKAIEAVQNFLDDTNTVTKMKPLQKAVMQRDLLATFFWSIGDHVGKEAFEIGSKPGHRRLTKLLANAINAIALTPEEIGKLPSNFHEAVQKNKAPGIPADLLDDNGNWVALEPPDSADRIAGKSHFRQFNGRSIFEVRFKHPNGRSAAESYLKLLGQVKMPYTTNLNVKDKRFAAFTPSEGPWPNPDTPQFPDGSQWALVRRAILSDKEGNPAASPIVESIQLRIYHNALSSEPNAQSFFEWELRRKSLFKEGAFHAVEPGEGQYGHFFSKQFDPFETPGARLRAATKPATLNCFQCHQGQGIHTVLSRSRAFTEPMGWPNHFAIVTQSRLNQTAKEEAARLAEWQLLKWIIND